MGCRGGVTRKFLLEKLRVGFMLNGRLEMLKKRGLNKKEVGKNREGGCNT